MSETPSTTALPRWLSPARLDRIEQVAVVALWALMLYRMVSSPVPFAPLSLIAETSVALFVIIRRPTEAISLRLGDWLLAVTATCAPLLIVPAAAPPALQALAPLALALVMTGNVAQISGKLSLFRSFGIAPANRGIKRDGMYRLVRHPIYAGYLLVHIGVLIGMPSLTNLTIYAIGWWAQILRLLAEERLLGEDPEYQDYMKQVRWRLVPGIF